MRLIEKVRFFIDFYEAERARWREESRPPDIGDWVRRDIKWISELEALLCADKPLRFQEERIRVASYRPFCTEWTYYDSHITHRPYQNDRMFPLLVIGTMPH